MHKAFSSKSLYCLWLLPMLGCPLVAKAEGLAITQAFTLSPVGHYGRSIVHTDALEAEIVAGKPIKPTVGEAVTLPDGSVKVWQQASVDKKGILSQKELRGGYADLVVECQKHQIAILSAMGDAMVYVNGIPFPGDPYEIGIVHLPIELQPGRNDLLFLCTSDTLKVQLTSPRSPVMLDPSDTTLPDLIVGRKATIWGALVLLNATEREQKGLWLAVSVGHGKVVETMVPTLSPLSVRKVGFRIVASAFAQDGNVPLSVTLLAKDGRTVLDKTSLSLRIRQPYQTYKVTFRSGIDGSVQYYAVNPANPLPGQKALPALVLTLHGAGVEAIGQADAYESKSWATLVAPTNRRPFGFDWEDWGRMDALEVLAHAERTLPYDPERVYLTGHSMGGHGTWQIGARFPDKFAAIGPCSGWCSFFSYVHLPRYPDDPRIGTMLNRANNVSDTLLLGHNYAQEGVYILHGADDTTVPVTEARNMAKYLSTFHKDYRYHEQPGVGHWWDISPEPGADCEDWAPLFDFFAHHALPPVDGVRRISFTTLNPGISSWDEWLAIEQQQHALEPSSVQMQVNPGLRQFVGTTDNVACLCLALDKVLPPSKAVTVELDDQKLESIPWPLGGKLFLYRSTTRWYVGKAPALTDKNPLRYGPFKEAFSHNMVFVYGTHGTPEENALLYAKARFDAETFWYRGNGSVDVVPDTEFQTSAEPNRSVILYGNAQTNRAWQALLGDSPLQVTEGEVRMGEHFWKGDDLACLFVRPRPGSAVASVAVFAATGSVGLRLLQRLPVFLSGVAWPDATVLSAQMLTEGLRGVLAAGYFGNDWGLADGDIFILFPHP
ncbi:prolyl oligopeptidase family serine peptidase [Chthonomonas calidirosea]|uniref:carboxylesterase family protein n=1 Tax=Chthonomonas calidirosea TaxID=454171 RepID=UPI0006EC6D80|nr:prolyl oligopeptidase family serine peptidase [Chthonomonas calidirosea]CEK13159.1 Alpha/beta hydrolase family [Chthonomonas calidirosea]